MAKKTVYICDGVNCGSGDSGPAVLVNPEDGFVLTGTVTNTTITGEPKILVGSSTEPGTSNELSLCRECMAKALGFHT